jgi:hypothetical protein
MTASFPSSERCRDSIVLAVGILTACFHLPGAQWYVSLGEITGTRTKENGKKKKLTIFVPVLFISLTPLEKLCWWWTQQRNHFGEMVGCVELHVCLAVNREEGCRLDKVPGLAGFDVRCMRWSLTVRAKFHMSTA